jgi:hypothetical protein
MFARMTKDDDGKMLIEIIDSWLKLTISADQDLQEIYLQAHKALADKGFIRSAPWHYLEGDGHRAPLFDRELTSPRPTVDSQAMLTSSKNLGLRALQTLDKVRAEASVGNRDHTKNHTYMKARAALDAHCEQLAHLMWVHKHRDGGDGTPGEYPSAADAEKYLRNLAEKEQA